MHQLSYLKRIVTASFLITAAIALSPAWAGKGNTPYAKVVADKFEEIKIVKYAEVKDGPDKPLAQMVLLINLDLFLHIPLPLRKKSIREWGEVFAAKFPGYALTCGIYSLEKEKIAHIIRKLDEQGQPQNLEFQFYEPGGNKPIFVEEGSVPAAHEEKSDAPAATDIPDQPERSSPIIPIIAFIVILGLILVVARFLIPTSGQGQTDSDTHAPDDSDRQEPPQQQPPGESKE